MREDYTNPLHFDPEGPVLLLPGSRKQAVGRIFPVMVETIKAYRAAGGDRSCTCLYPEEQILGILEAELERQGVDKSLIDLKPVEQGSGASAVLTSSGTMSLNCALAGLPGAVVYRAHPLTVWMGRRLVRIEWLGIANLVLGREVYPEYLQKEASPTALLKLLQECLSDPSRREAFEAAASALSTVLSGTPSTTVARRIRELVGDRGESA
jgi:lipid-A-disaccharide synthase